MIQKKVCMLGAFSVGKTCLVSRYVDSLFTDKYTTSIGVKIDKKRLTVNGQEMTLLLWDIYGEDSAQTVLPSYLRGVAGYILVIDPTRPKTFKSALSLHQLVRDTIGDKPLMLVLNKSDIRNEWQIEPPDLKEELRQLKASAIRVCLTSAKEDTGVDEMFASLAEAMLPVPAHGFSSAVEDHVNKIGVSVDKITSFKIDDNNLVLHTGGRLTRSGIRTLNELAPIDEQIPVLSGLLPHRGKPLCMKNINSGNDNFVDMHILVEQNHCSVLFVDNTEAGIKLQEEQQVRLTNDIVNESG